MAKFFGAVGYVKTQEAAPGVWEEVVTEREYYGDVVKNVSRWQASGSLNDDIITSNSISILADPFAFENFMYMKFVRWMGVSWNISSVDNKRPRLILTLGGVYNEP